MHGRVHNTKIIFDPIWGIIDITQHLPMIDTPEFQALGFKYQLGVTSLLFPSATHTRKQHSFGAFRRASDLGLRWQQQGMITADQAKTMAAFALWHDIGHGPFSHVAEAVTKERYGRDHNQNGKLIIERMVKILEVMGIDPAEMQRFFAHKDPVSLGVSDKNLGAEKLDYLSRDAYYTLGEKPGVEYLAHHTYLIDDQIMVDEKVIDQAKSIQEFYVKMYKLVYLRKNSIIAQRMVQKMTSALLQRAPMAEEQFWGLTDFALLGQFETSPDPLVRAYYQRLMNRNLPKTAIALRPNQFASIGDRIDKAQITLGVNETQMQQLVAAPSLSSPQGLEQAELQIEKLAGLPAGSIVLLPPPTPERFVPQDITIFTGSRAPAKLSDYFSGHFEALREEGLSYMTLRVCTFEPHRQKLSQPDIAEAVRAHLLSLTTPH